MRFIDRTQLRYPKVLSSPQAEDALGELQSFIAITAEQGETRRVPSSDWLTRDDSFRFDMAQSFDHNCAYCEAVARPNYSMPDTGVISRHRPETLAQDEDGNTEFLAYSWLMYDWDNLLWVCVDCARRKGNRFYIEAKRGAPGMPVDALRESEQELMLDPCWHAPSEHLAFQLNGGLNWKTAQGHATTEVLGLDRENLVQARQKTNIAMLTSLRTEPLELIPTGANAPFDQFFPMVFLSSDEHSGGEWLPVEAHRGAALNALLNFARFRGMEFEDASQFMASFSDLDTENREAFLEDALNEASKAEPDLAIKGFKIEETAPPTPSRSDRPKRNRTPDIRRMPYAQSLLSGVSINNFRALRSIDFDLPTMVADPEQAPCMILLGENATGKSSVLEAMALAIIGAQETAELGALLPDEDLTPQSLIHRPDPSDWNTTADNMAIVLRFQDQSAPVGLFAGPADTTFDGAQECSKVVLGYGPRRYFTSKRTRRFRAPAHRVRSMFDPMDMIANPIHWLTSLDGRNFGAAARVLRVILMLDNDDDFVRNDPEPDAKEAEHGQIFVTQNGQRTALRDLSVGYKSVIAMACDIIREMLYHFDNLEFAHGVVFIDEIETHLHPRWKMQIMQLLRGAFPKVQFIVTTHDPLCLRGMYNGEVFVLRRSALDAQVEKLDDLPSIRGMRAEQILTSEFFGLGSTDPETDAKLERYNRLAARLERLSPVEQAELERLSTALDSNMVIGTTMAEQAYAEALKAENAKAAVEPTKAASPRRKDLEDRFGALYAGPRRP